MLDVKKTIVVLEQAKREIDQAIHALQSADSDGASFAIEDVESCLSAAKEDIDSLRRGRS